VSLNPSTLLLFRISEQAHEKLSRLRKESAFTLTYTRPEQRG
jgi:hypothetical protein